MAVSFHLQTSKFPSPKKKNLIDWILLVAYQEQKEIKDISYVFCDDNYLRLLNKKFLHHNVYTDVITFDDSHDNKIVAEIYISIDRIRENTFKFQTPFLNELLRVMVHGLLHCMGFSDNNIVSKAAMTDKENSYVNLYFEL